MDIYYEHNIIIFSFIAPENLKTHYILIFIFETLSCSYGGWIINLKSACYCRNLWYFASLLPILKVGQM